MLTNKHSYKEGAKQLQQDKRRASHFHNKKYNHEYEQGVKYTKDDNFHKTHEGFHSKNHHYKKDRNYEYENRKERMYEEKQTPNKTYHKNFDHGKNYQKNNWKKENEKQDNERGEENKKPVFNSQRKQENKAIFAHQLKSIQKTLIPTDGKPKACPNTLTEVGPGQPGKSESKPPPKVTTLVGSGIVNDLMKNTDDFIITSMDKEESKQVSAVDTTKTNFGSSKETASKSNSTLNRDKRTNTGFRTSAAAMFSNQTGGKCTYADYN